MLKALLISLFAPVRPARWPKRRRRKLWLSWGPGQPEIQPTQRT